MDENLMSRIISSTLTIMPVMPRPDMVAETIPTPGWCQQHRKILQHSTKTASWFPDESTEENLPFHLQHSKHYPEWGCYTKEEAMLTLRQLARTIPGHQPEEDVPEMLSHLSDLLRQYFEFDVDNVTDVVLQLCGSPRLTMRVIDLLEFEQLAFVVEHLSVTQSLPKVLFERDCVKDALPFMLRNCPAKLSLLLFHGVPCEIPAWMDGVLRMCFSNGTSFGRIQSSRQRTAVFFYLLYDIAITSRRLDEDYVFEELEEFIHMWRLCDPQPLLTPLEMRTLVEPVLPSFEFLDMMHLDAISMMAYYRTFCNIAKSSLQPRRLQHLCRCVIRRRLFDNGCLVFGVESLDIPKALKDVLMLRKVEHTGVVRMRPGRKRKLPS